MAADLGGFKRTLVYATEGPAEQLIADVEEIRKFDRESENRLRVWKFLTAGSVLAIGLGIFLMISRAFGEERSFQAFLGCVTLGGVGLITGIVLWVRGSRFDLANRRYELFAALVEMLRRDMPKDATISVALDLSPPTEKRKKSGEGKAGKWDVVHYQDSWLKLRGRFADGTTFQVAMIDKTQLRSRWKRSASGKNKRKTKTKAATVAVVKLSPKSKRYPDLSRVAGQIWKLVRIPSWCRVKGATASAEELTLVTTTAALWSVRGADAATKFDGFELVGSMFFSLYQALHVSKSSAA
ncbi:MAG: hypothetical protein NT069_14345 [Planctomycetota bacterium]|nr:hypothetical protein [Planctomycetota bacterium]